QRVDQGASRLDRNRVATGTNARRVEPGLARSDVEFPAMPRAAQDLTGPTIAVLAGYLGPEVAGQAASAQGAALVRAAISQREEFASDVEDSNRSSVYLDDLALAR